jgi:hypothetical protein
VKLSRGKTVDLYIRIRLSYKASRCVCTYLNILGCYTDPHAGGCHSRNDAGVCSSICINPPQVQFVDSRILELSEDTRGMRCQVVREDCMIDG